MTAARPARRPPFMLILAGAMLIAAPALGQDLWSPLVCRNIGAPFDAWLRSKPEQTRRLASRVDAGASPEGDAATAARAGDFRLVWGRALLGAGPVGVECAAPNRKNSGPVPTELAEITFGDVPIKAEMERTEKLVAYGIRYNRALIANARFPYADICRVPGRDRVAPSGFSEPGGFSAWSGRAVQRTHDLSEAARHGAVSEVRRWIASGSDVSTVDLFDMTPLAWAVVRGRADVAALLLEAGADPLRGPACDFDMEASPLKLALLMGKPGVVAQLLTPATLERLRPWPRPLIEAAVAGAHPALVARMLAEPHERVQMETLFTLARRTSADGMVEVLIAGGGEGAAESLLATAIRSGEMPLLRRALKLGAPLGPWQGGRVSPLGDAVQSPSADLDLLVAALLQAGAPVDSPAEPYGGNGYPAGSSPPTALVTLVATLNRDHGPGAGADAAYDARTRAQRRAIGLLLAAEASTAARDSHGRPLVFVAIAGIGESTKPVRRPQLYPGVLTELAAAGMDPNARWAGMTALDWLTAAQDADGVAARELRALGGRRSDEPAQ